MTDERPTAEPDLFAYVPLGETPEETQQAVLQKGNAMQRRGSRWARFTAVTPEHPKPPYPHGVYIEGWLVRPHEMDPPHREAPFALGVIYMAPETLRR